ncbi:MAG: GGDEF domain-containing protein [Proteobacteria bacterium]|nr:GGDEF domain-containing protein [Pseudomonadota bacterium]
MKNPRNQGEVRAVVALLALSSVATALTIGHRMWSGSNPVELFFLALAVPFLAGMAWTLRQRPRLLEPIVALLATTGAVYLAVRTGLAAFTSSEAEHLRAELAHAAAFAPVVYLLAVMGLDQGRARRLTISLWALLAGLVLVALFSPTGRTIDPMERYGISEWFLIAHGLLLIFLSVYGSARRRAARGDRALTGLANRRALEEERRRDLSRGVTPNGPSVSVVLIDIDRFKDVNDRFGHLVGDEVLIAFGRALERQVRTGDIVGRWGGEEFMLVLRRTDLPAAYALAERVRESVATTLFPTVRASRRAWASVRRGRTSR